MSNVMSRSLPGSNFFYPVMESPHLPVYEAVLWGDIPLMFAAI
jgi:hypothetical protein